MAFDKDRVVRLMWPINFVYDYYFLCARVNKSLPMQTNKREKKNGNNTQHNNNQNHNNRNVKYCPRI